MKYFKFFYILFVSFLVLTSCKSDKKSSFHSEYIRPSSLDYTHKDTAEINSLVNNYVQCISNKDYDVASSLLYKVRNDSVFPLTPNERSDFKIAYSHMPIYKCKVKSFVLRSDKNNEVKISIQIISSGNIDNDEGVTSVSLNPVLIRGKWYLTLLDTNAEGVENVYEVDGQ